MTRAKQANESSETDPKESKHGEDLYQNAGEGDRSHAIDFKGGQNFGEGQQSTVRVIGVFGLHAFLFGTYRTTNPPASAVIIRTVSPIPNDPDFVLRYPNR